MIKKSLPSCAEMQVRWGYVLILTISMMQLSFTLIEHSTKPKNTVSIVGTKAKMECRRNTSVLPINWEFASTGSNNFSYIYASRRLTESLSSRYNIDTDGKTRYDVVMDSVDLFHAGTYRCEPITKEVINASSDSAQLVVIGRLSV